MPKLILPILVLVVALATSAVALCGDDRSGSTAQPAAKPPTKNIGQTAVRAGDFDTLVSLVKRAGLAKTLSGKGPFTVFAPPMRPSRRSPQARSRGCRKPERRYGRCSSTAWPAAAIPRSGWPSYGIETLAGERVKVGTRGGTVRVGGARVVQAAVRTSNGVIHAINGVLIPFRPRWYPLGTSRLPPLPL